MKSSSTSYFQGKDDPCLKKRIDLKCVKTNTLFHCNSPHSLSSLILAMNTTDDDVVCYRSTVTNFRNRVPFIVLVVRYGTGSDLWAPHVQGRYAWPQSHVFAKSFPTMCLKYLEIV